MTGSLRTTYDQYIQAGGSSENFAHEVVPGSGIIATAINTARGVDFRTQQVPRTNAQIWKNAQMTATILSAEQQAQ